MEVHLFSLSDNIRVRAVLDSSFKFLFNLMDTLYPVITISCYQVSCNLASLINIYSISPSHLLTRLHPLFDSVMDTAFACAFVEII